MYKACIFDLDGTLTDTLESLVFSVNKTMEEIGLPGITEDHTDMGHCFLRSVNRHDLICLKPHSEAFLIAVLYRLEQLRQISQ